MYLPKAIVLLDEVNDMATRLSETIKKNEEPQTVITGADATDLQRGSDWSWFLMNPEARADFPCTAD